ncbi:PIN domain-containing protein [Desulfoprunum benzoelyticum]|uniref:Putative nucleic acid-binding protein n=1 Tax=Desulfoprunum benzoelyticum TaxID=1506996 RepID=A0A840UQI9_9BACT|nr:PIN domain-containing protein [Desulfoprunum benzoelyticum]MBB5348052.1 putative nucleic acid-binding protein [Desulfoprunum benzoelyticum]MBM9531408.1 PIN domain-containing protein [Desulfoprunum benzoelyticum]
MDDQSYSRIHLETIAVRLILKTVEAGRYRLITSPVHEIEISNIANDSERIDLLLMLEKLGVRIAIDNEAARACAEKLFRQGLGPADAAHIAFAEAAQADFISCDDKLIKKCSRMTVDVWTGNPVAFCDKENLR